MGWFHSYCRAYQKASSAIVAARKTYLDKVNRIQGYEGSARYDDERSRIESEYLEAVEDARLDVRDTLAESIQGMRNATAKPVVEAPTAEQLRLIDAIRLVNHPDGAMLAAVAEKLSGNDLALSALRSVLAEKNMLLPASSLPLSDRVNEAVESLARAARSIQAWNGTTWRELSRDLVQRNHDARWANGHMPDANDWLPMNAAEIGAIDPGETARTTARRITDADDAVLDVLERM